MEWFGPSWGAPMNETCGQVPTPDWPCLACGKGFRGPTFGEEADRGVVTPFVGDPDGRGKAAYHLRCFTKTLGLDELREGGP